MEFSKDKWKIYTWKNWMMIHWILNPGLAFNELILGQRVPKLSLVDKTSDKPLLERSYVPCPHCDEIHDHRIWSNQKNTGFKNWFGLYCPNCGEIIPCLRNALSALLLLVLFPIGYFVKDRMKESWLKKQPIRYENINIDNIQNPYEGTGWVKQGLIWGLFMFIIMALAYPIAIYQTLEIKSVLIGIPLWAFGGLFWGYMMKTFYAPKNNTATSDK